MNLLKEPISNNVDILMVSDTKIDELLPEAQFCIDGYSSPYRFDGNACGGSILLYKRR